MLVLLTAPLSKLALRITAHFLSRRAALYATRVMGFGNEIRLNPSAVKALSGR
jgi:hypothetical protein